MINNKSLAKVFLTISLVSFCSTGFAKTKKHDHINHQKGTASFFNDKYHGKLTANGERYNKYALTAAHATLPFGTMIHVVNLRNHHSIDVRINSRLHHSNKRLLDLSKQAAKDLGFLQAGLTKVEISVLHLGKV